MLYVHLNVTVYRRRVCFLFFYIFCLGCWECLDNLHVTGTGTDQQSYSGNNGLADGGAGRLGHVRGDEVL